MRALVTGATGCVGANVVEALLSRGYEVRAMRREASRLDALSGLQPEIVVGDVLDTTSLMQAMSGCDLVFHVAAVSEYWRSKPQHIFNVNVTGTHNVLLAAAQSHIQRLIFTSSVAVFGRPSDDGTILNESNPYSQYPIPFHYGHSKMLAEAEVDSFVHEGLDVVVVNPASVIGQRDIYFIGGELIKVVTKGWFFAVPNGGMGVVSAKDVGLGHVLAAEKGRTGERYILNGENISHYKLISIMAKTTGVPAPRFTVPRSLGRFAARMLHMLNRIGLRFGDFDPIQIYLGGFDMYFDSTKAKKELGFAPCNASESVAEAVAWYRQQGLL